MREELAIAFCGPMNLTAEGEREFAEVLEYPVELFADFAMICVDDADDVVWEARLEKARKFFHAMAGYCADSDYKRWFKED